MLSLGRFLSQRAATLSAQSEHIPSGKKEKQTETDPKLSSS